MTAIAVCGLTAANPANTAEPVVSVMLDPEPAEEPPAKAAASSVSAACACGLTSADPENTAAVVAASVDVTGLTRDAPENTVPAEVIAANVVGLTIEAAAVVADAVWMLNAA